MLFADLVGFTELSSRRPAAEIVQILNELFSRFDQAADELGVEKIKTIGDAYMAVCGLPEPRADHADRMVRMALRMLSVVREFNAARGWISAPALNPCRSRSRRGHRPEQVHLRPVGRHREPREPDGIPRYRRCGPDDPKRGGTARGPVSV